LSQLAATLTRPVRRIAFRRRFYGEFLPSLPEPYRPAALLAFTRQREPDEDAVAKEVESFRSEIPALAAKPKLLSHPSPHSGTFSTDDSGHSSPAALAEAPVEAHMKTGVDPYGGLLLRRLVEGTGARRVLELGTNTGFSGRYILSAPACEWLDTVEGSSDLCELARINLARTSDRFRVLNTLFDEALDELRSGEPYDAAFLDGQHEREATLHYVDRMLALLNPGGMIILDDIYWSEDMHNAWEDVRRDDRLPLTIDYGSKGIAVAAGGGDGLAGHFDLCPYVGRPAIHRRGW
jgi:predicted O-methyltransferase YrrM